jgi:Leucine-rich repeat (LRR) protein
METQLQDYFNGLCCPTPVVTYNFDVDSSDWAGAGITDQASFDSVLGVTTSDFLLSGNNIKANILTTNGNNINLLSRQITNIGYITVSGLIEIDLGSNQIATFNPTIALPSSLQNLYLADNQIVDFNPTIALPSSLVFLGLHSNQIVNFNPSIALPSSLQFLNLSSNQMTTSGYTASEPWANGMHNAPSGGAIEIHSNTNSATGTNLETILIAKGWTVAF